MDALNLHNVSLVFRQPMIWYQQIDETLSGGDPTIRSWFLVRQPILPLLLSVFYTIFSTRLGPALMKDRSPFELRKTMIVFNFSIVIAYVICLYLVVTNLSRISWNTFCIGGAAANGKPEYMLACAAWGIYVLKYIEFFDTVFFVLRKKQSLITLLHVIHHTSVPLLGWIMIRMENSGMQAIPVLINACVHVIMYTYYGLAAMGPSMQKHLWWKKYLTQIQMAQFVTIIVFVTIVVPMTNCTMKISSFIADILFATMFLYLFYHYYQMAFKTKKN